MVCMSKTSIVLAKVDDLKELGCTATVDREAGTVEVKDGDVVVYKALQKGKGQPWIVRCVNSERVWWQK